MSDRTRRRLRAAAHHLTAAWFALAGRHYHLSPGCLHGEHDYCAAMVGRQGAKRPATFKWCGTPCRCRCHRQTEAPTDA